MSIFARACICVAVTLVGAWCAPAAHADEFTLPVSHWAAIVSVDSNGHSQSRTLNFTASHRAQRIAQYKA